jgi:hypothetical protein
MGRGLVLVRHGRTTVAAFGRARGGIGSEARLGSVVSGFGHGGISPSFAYRLAGAERAE